MTNVFNSWDGSLTFSSSYFFHFTDISLRFSFNKRRKTATWKKKDNDPQKQLNNWEETSPFFERNIPPHEDITFVSDSCGKKLASNQQIMSVSKVNITFTMTLDKLKAFIAILVVSRYTKIPRQEIYWEQREDRHNLLVSSMMSKN